MKKPRTKISNIRNQMLALMPPGSSAKASCTSFSPCRPRKPSENTCAQIRMNITMALMRVVDCTVSRSTRTDSRRPIAATRIEPSAPMAAASDGAAMPAMIEPSTATTSPIGGATTRTILPASCAPEIASRSACGIGGTMSGRIMPSSNR